MERHCGNADSSPLHQSSKRADGLTPCDQSLILQASHLRPPLGHWWVQMFGQVAESIAMPEDRQSIVPRFYVALPKSGPADVEIPADDAPVMRPFLADLLIAYAYDMGTHYTLVPYRDLPKLGLTEQELHDCAVSNFRNLNCPMEAHGGSPVFMLTAGGNYEATAVLLPEVCASLSALVSGRLVAALAARDLLFFTGDGRQEDVGKLRAVTSQGLEKADKPLSRNLILWNGHEWELYRGYAE